MSPLKKASGPGGRWLLLPPEYAFLVIGLLFGVMLIYANPPFQSNDEDRHFYNAYFISTGQLVPRQQGDAVGGMLPTDVLTMVTGFQAIPFNSGTKLGTAKVTDQAATPLLLRESVFYDNPSYALNPVPYVPFAVGIRAGSVVNTNPITMLRGARFAGLVTFLVIVFVAIRTMPVHKFVLFAVALTPMTMFQAASVTYDTLCNALCFLVTALTLSWAMRETAMTRRELITLALFAVLLRFVKNGYFLVPFLFFLIPQKNIGTRWRSASMAVALLAASLLPQLTWDAYLSSLHLHTAKSLQKDWFFDGATQLALYKERPFDLVAAIGLNILAQGKESIIGAIGRFGYSYAELPQPVAFGHGLVLIAISVLDSTPGRSLTSRQKLVVFGVAAGTAALIIAGYFILFSPVGGRTIFGLQGRYFIPIMPLLLLLNYGTFVKIGFWDRWKSLLVPAYSASVLGYTVVFIDRYFWAP